LKTRLLRLFVRIWDVLSEVPGWPDAPVDVRLRRVAPMLAAVIGCLALTAWKYGWRHPEIEQVRSSHAYLLDLEQEVAALRLAFSEQQATTMSARAEAAAAALLDSPDDVAELLRQVREQIRTLGWDATFQAYDSVTDDDGVTAGAGVRFSAARAHLVPLADNPAPFQSLLGVFDQFSGLPKRIDLTRLGIRADEAGTLEVDLNLRVACRAAHEEAS